MVARIRRSMSERDRGFTLIELLVVIIIIGILAAIAIPVFLNQRKKGVDSGIKADLRNAATAAETYATDNPSSATFGTDDADVKVNVVASGFKATTGNTVEIAGGPAGGFCVRGYNAGGTATAAGTAFWYDSALGGLQSGAPGANPTGGVCDDLSLDWAAIN